MSSFVATRHQAQRNDRPRFDGERCKTSGRRRIRARPAPGTFRFASRLTSGVASIPQKQAITTLGNLSIFIRLPPFVRKIHASHAVVAASSAIVDVVRGELRITVYCVPTVILRIGSLPSQPSAASAIWRKNAPFVPLISEISIARSSCPLSRKALRLLEPPNPPV
jgi:hypothetical protein